jgi:hypothetical protein
MNNGAGNRNALLFTAGELAWQLAEVGAHADLFENCGCFLGGRSQGHARRDQGDGRVLRRSQRWQKIVLLKNETHGTAAKGHLLRVRQLSDWYAARLDHSSRGAEDAGDDRDEGRLSTTRRPDQHGQLSRRRLKVDSVEYLHESATGRKRFGDAATPDRD